MNLRPLIEKYKSMKTYAGALKDGYVFGKKVALETESRLEKYLQGTNDPDNEVMLQANATNYCEIIGSLRSGQYSPIKLGYGFYMVTHRGKMATMKRASRAFKDLESFLF